jgi:hypothetical protein
MHPSPCIFCAIKQKKAIKKGRCNNTDNAREMPPRALLAGEENEADGEEDTAMPSIAERHRAGATTNGKSKSQTEQRLEAKILSAKSQKSAADLIKNHSVEKSSKDKGKGKSASSTALSRRRASTKRGMSFSLVTLEQNLMMPSDDEDEDDMVQSTGDSVEDLLNFLRAKIARVQTGAPHRRWSVAPESIKDSGSSKLMKYERDLAVLSRNKGIMREKIVNRPLADLKRNVGHLAAQIRKEEAARAQNNKRRLSVRKGSACTPSDRAERMAALEFDTLHGFARLQSRQNNWLKQLALAYRVAQMGARLEKVRSVQNETTGAARYIQTTWRGHFKKRMDSSLVEFSEEISPEMQWRWSLYIKCFKRRNSAIMIRSFFKNFGRPTMAIAVEGFRSDIIQMQVHISSLSFWFFVFRSYLLSHISFTLPEHSSTHFGTPTFAVELDT